MAATCPTCRSRFDRGQFCPRDGAKLVEEAPARVLAGRYALRRKVGEGAMGEVYEAEHVHLHRRVAVKILRPTIAAIPEAIARMQREAESMSGLGHPNIVDAIDFGHTDDGVAFLVMEWLEGENLDDMLARQRPDIATALDIAAQAAAGLAEAHRRGVIHRDLKPANLFVTTNHKGALVIKVVDFGIAKLAEENTRLTATGVLVGTPNYMAPEQAMGEAVDARADIYALGVILYEMLTGVVPFRGDTALAVLHQHTSKMAALPSAAAPDRAISAELDDLVMRCLAKQPADRFASMEELGDALAVLQGRPVMSPRVAAEPEASRTLPRRIGARVLVLGGLAIAAVGAAIVAFATRGSHPAARADAALAVATRDAAMIAVASPDAALAPARPDASESGLDLHAKTPLFSYSAALPHQTAADVPFDLAIGISDLDPSVTWTPNTPLLARVLVRYYIDHSIVYQAAQPLDDSSRIIAHVTTLKPGKHHVHVELLSGTRELGHATFDIFVGEDRAPVAAADHEHGHDHDHDDDHH